MNRDGYKPLKNEVGSGPIKIKPKQSSEDAVDKLGTAESQNN